MHSISALTQLTLVLLSACKYICIYKVQRATHMTMKKIYSNPRLGVSRPATAMVINLSKEKRWQIKAFKCSYFLYTSERIDVSPRSATNYPQREKQLTADSWMWGIHSLRRSHTQTDRLVWNSVNLTAPSTHRAQLLPYWCNADTWGNNYSSKDIFLLSLLFVSLFHVEVLMPIQLHMAFTLELHAFLVPTTLTYSNSWGNIFYYHI